MNIWEKILKRLEHWGEYVAVLVKWIAIGFVVGVVGGGVGAAFHIGVEWATELRHAHPQVLWLLPVAGALIVLLYRALRLEGEGTNKIIESVHFGSDVPLLLGITVPIFNILAVISLETFRGGKPSVKKMLRGIATNPLIIASVLGIAMNLAKMPIPTGVHKSITDLGRIATPLALVSLGAGFQFKRIKGYARQLIICISGKLVIGPVIMLTLAALLGFREEMLVPVLALFGSPVATSSYTMAELMDGDGVLAGSLVVLTTALSILTMFLFIFALKQLGLV